MTYTNVAYLAAPYSSSTKEQTNELIKQFCIVDGKLSANEIIAVSPLHKHLLFMHDVDLPSDWSYWKKYCVSLLHRCDYMIVIKLPGWDISEGVTAEILIAKSLNTKIVYIDPNEDFVNVIKLFESEHAISSDRRRYRDR